MAHNFQRPKLPYEAESLPNNKRYQLLTRSNKRPPTDVMLDTDVNYLIYAVRQLDDDIAGVEAGIIQGSDDPANANFLVTTDGAGNTGWVKVQDSNIVDHSISRLKLIPQTITATEIQDGTITAAQLADGAVGTSEIADLAVTTDKIAIGAVTATEIASLAVTSAKIRDSNVTTAKIANNAITTDKLAANAVTTAKIAVGAVTTSELGVQAVTTARIAVGAVTTSELGAQAVTAAKIANDTITFTQISSSFTATQAQQQAASSSSVYVSPATQKYHPSGIKAEVSFNGNDGTLLYAYGVSSVVKIGQGIFKITFSSPFSTNVYLTQITPESDNTPRFGNVDRTFAPTTTQIQVKIWTPAGNVGDCETVNCTFTGVVA